MAQLNDPSRLYDTVGYVLASIAEQAPLVVLLDSVYEGYGTGNVFRNNTVDGAIPGYGIGLYPALGNVVGCDNSAPGAELGLVGDNGHSATCAP